MSFQISSAASSSGQPLRGVGEDVRALLVEVAPLVAGQDHRLDRDPVGRGAGGDAHRVADRPAAELQHHVLAEVVEQLVHLAGVDPARGDRHHAGQRRPVLVEVQARGSGLAWLKRSPAARRSSRARCRDRPRACRRRCPAWMWSTPISRHHFASTRNETPWLFWRVYVLWPARCRCSSTPVGAAPPRHRRERGEADREVHHHDHAADVAGELGALVHLLHRGGRHVHVVALDLARRGRGAHHGLHREQVPVAPAHERLGVDVLVVLGEVEPAAQRLVHHPAVVPRRQPELGLRGGAEQRAAELVEVLALHHDPVRPAPGTS